MSDRPELSIKLKSNEFLEYYYLKEELVSFCRENRLPASGGKAELHRAFFKREIGDSFSFNVAFQKWLKSNSGKTYADAIAV